MFKLISFRSDGAFWPFAERSDFDAAARPRSLIGGLLAAPRRVVARIGKELAARRAMHALASLDERMLRDIGLERDQIGYAARHGRRSRRTQDVRADLVALVVSPPIPSAIRLVRIANATLALRRGHRGGRLFSSSAGGRGNLARQVGGRDQHRELLAPDDDALELREVEAGGNGVALAALEGAQPPQVDEHLPGEIARGPQLRPRHQVDVELGARADLEIARPETRCPAAR